MNKRIDALEVQAWEIVDNTWDWTKPDNPNKATLFKTIFAELIVKACADLFEIEYGTSEVSGNEVARVLKQHFGVE